MMKRFARFMVCAVAALLTMGKSDAQWTEPVLLPPPINVNPPGEYYYATISADGQILCITIDPGIYGNDDVYVSERMGDSAWAVPINAGPNVNTNQRNLSPSVTSDRQRLYYVCWTGLSYDIFVSERTGPDWDDWSPGMALPEPINRGDEFTAMIGYDDSTLVFTSTFRPDTVPVWGDHVMYTSRLRPDGSWSEPHIIAPHINRMNGSDHPCLTDSGRTLVYAWFVGTELAIYYAFLNDTGYGPAIRCDSTINTGFWNSNPSCPVDGSLLYFDSRRNEHHVSRLYVAPRAESATPYRWHPPSRRSDIEVIPSFGTTNTTFQISVAAEFKGMPIRIVNILGQTVGVISPTERWQTQFNWKGENHGEHVLSNGAYFFVVSDQTRMAVGKVFILK